MKLPKIDWAKANFISFILLGIAICINVFHLNKLNRKMENNLIQKDKKIEVLEKSLLQLQKENDLIKKDLNFILFDLYYIEEEKEMTYEDLFKNNEIKE